jgi:Protein of unknown function (DUF2827)
MKQITVGVTIDAKDHIKIWHNGINQNIAFLIQLLQISPAVKKVFLLNGGDADFDALNMHFEGIDVQIVRPKDVLNELDLIIEMGTLLRYHILRRAHDLGIKIVHFTVGQLFILDSESIMFNRRIGLIYDEPSFRSEIWTLPEYMKTCAPLLKVQTGRPVVEMPHLWSPYFLNRLIHAEALGTNDREKSYGFHAETAAQRKGGWKIGIFEPNISIAKNCFIPILACEETYREECQAISEMHVFNARKLIDQESFKDLLNSLDLTRDGKSHVAPREVFSKSMTTLQLDAIVSHSWENEQNYLSYETLYGGYPLIHNSRFLKDAGVGIHFSGFNAKEGAHHLINTWKQPVDFWYDYRRKSADYLKTLDPYYVENVKIFTERIQHVMETSS